MSVHAVEDAQEVAECCERRAAEDRRLMRETAQRDRSAFDALYRRYQPMVRSRARQLLLDNDAADDVVQTVFLELWRHASRYDPARGAVSTWMSTLAHHRSVDAVRREDQHRRRRAAQDHLVAAVDPGRGPDELALLSLNVAGVRAALEQLDPKHAATLQLAYFGEQTLRQVAVVMGVPEGTAKSRARSGLRQLRALLAESARSA